MDCGGVCGAIEAKQSQTYAQIGIAVLGKRLQATKQQGEAAVQLIAAAAEVAKQLGRGVNFDARA